MNNLVIVGEAPSKHNLSEDIPFVGADCFKRLTDWLKILQPDYYIVYNSETEKELLNIELLEANGFKVIALGQQASVRLRDRGIPHFTLPHPSGRNLQTNDKNFISQKLEQAWFYLREVKHGKVSNG